MGVQFGSWDFGGTGTSRDDLPEINRRLSPYAADGSHSYTDNEMLMTQHSFHTSEILPTVAQPYVSPSGSVYIWDGRLDNRLELVKALGGNAFTDSGDIVVVAAAHAFWGTTCFKRFVGDWALSIWDPATRTLLLAKDFLGTRHLFYRLERDGIRWSTLLEPLLLGARATLQLNEEYLAGWFSFLPAPHLSPYAGIASVPPASFLTVRPSGVEVRTYWDFDPGNQIRYRRDADYEEHFCHVFREAVRRRLDPTHPVLAELSGGFDSSSIVCMADRILAERPSVSAPIDTVSYYNDSEPDWNERPFFALVEEQRGKTGLHIDLTSSPITSLSFDDIPFRSTPDLRFLGRELPQFSEYLRRNGHRVVLSGMGGDELLGGVPTPMPELADLLVAGKLLVLIQKLKLWGLRKKRPWYFLFRDLVREFLPAPLCATPKSPGPLSWLETQFRSRQKAALRGYSERTRFFGPLPSFQANLASIDVLRRQVAAMELPSDPLFERRFPYLDRDLVEFLFAVPREQLVRPGERRSLMRRALRGILPDGILHRTRKASVSRTPLRALAAQSESLMAISDRLECVTLGIVDPMRFCDVLQCAREGRELRLVPVVRTLQLERWLRGLVACGFDLSLDSESRPSSTVSTQSAARRAYSISQLRTTEPERR
jgi:asparagine synthase (glutamine-hydrolysing)